MARRWWFRRAKKGRRLGHGDTPVFIKAELKKSIFFSAFNFKVLTRRTFGAVLGIVEHPLHIIILCRLSMTELSPILLHLQKWSFLGKLATSSTVLIYPHLKYWRYTLVLNYIGWGIARWWRLIIWAKDGSLNTLLIARALLAIHVLV